MYKTKALSEAGWLVNSNTDGFSYTMDRKKDLEQLQLEYYHQHLVVV